MHREIKVLPRCHKFDSKVKWGYSLYRGYINMTVDYFWWKKATKNKHEHTLASIISSIMEPLCSFIRYSISCTISIQTEKSYSIMVISSVFYLYIITIFSDLLAFHFLCFAILQPVECNKWHWMWMTIFLYDLHKNAGAD